MTKIHLLMKKEEMNQQKLSGNKTVVVFDILLATSTITATLEFGAKEVIPVLNGKEAVEISEGIKNNEVILIGEYNGATLDGFHSPNPLALRSVVNGKTIILSTTNGTIALKNAQAAKKVYAASILNSNSVVNHIRQTYDDETIVLVCAGSFGHFNMEDFYGAGYFIDCLISESIQLEMTDASLAALHFYRSFKGKELEILAESRVGKMMMNFGFEAELHFVSQKSIFNVVPMLENGKRIVDVKLSEKTAF
ncbi:2-phosphosulfolactate phosphatase [Gottfriedia sp. OAE603]|uniref:2-phosphosulfolactate phosphatase n=1 Tax=Gottfriedia sp. OAE603 TaxID=2663872 RepID=UPI0019FA5DB1